MVILYRNYLIPIIDCNFEDMKYFIYKKDRKEVVPVEDSFANKEAKSKLKELFENRESLGIPQRFIKGWKNVALFNSKGDVVKANAIIFPSEKSAYDLSNRLNDLTAKEWLPETISVFSQKGLGAGNKGAEIEKQHPAPFSFQDVARLIRFYSKGGDIVLDPFSGVGSTVKACAVEERIGYGIELNSKYHELAKQRIEIEVEESEFKSKQNLINGDSLELLNSFDDDFFDFIVTSPPYWNILDTVDHKSKQRIDSELDHKYSDSDNDLANIDDYEEFLEVLCSFFDSCHRVLKQGKYMCVVVSDFRKKDKFYIFHADIANKLESKGHFVLKGIRVLYQRHKSIFPYGYPYSFVPNLHHQNVLVFQLK